MNKESYKTKVKKLIKKSKEKGLLKTYEEFLETEESKKYAMVQEEVEYYTSNYYNKKLKKYKIGDIVFVSKYKYKNGKDGENHIMNY